MQKWSYNTRLQNFAVCCTLTLDTGAYRPRSTWFCPCFHSWRQRRCMRTWRNARWELCKLKRICLISSSTRKKNFFACSATDVGTWMRLWRSWNGLWVRMYKTVTYTVEANLTCIVLCFLLYPVWWKNINDDFGLYSSQIIEIHWKRIKTFGRKGNHLSRPLQALSYWRIGLWRYIWRRFWMQILQSIDVLGYWKIQMLALAGMEVSLCPLQLKDRNKILW